MLSIVATSPPRVPAVSGLEALYLVLALLGALACVFICTHLRPLNEDETEALATKRRTKELQGYFAFSREPATVNLDFKKHMKPGGTFYNIHDTLSHFPSRVASLLKYKKHEWMVVGMEKNREISLMWANKGSDGTRVCLSLPFDCLMAKAVANGHTSLLVFHNHPNSNPELYSCSQPSQVDLKSSAARAQILNDRGVNLVEFVCERGTAYKYCYSPAERFMPLSGFAKVLRVENGTSKLRNLSLHAKRIF